MSKKQQETSKGTGKASTRQWADEVIISSNPTKSGIELRFNAEPSPELKPKLRVMGFRPNKSQVMYYADDTSQTREFAEQVKVSLPASPEGPELFLSPSFDAVKSNIEKKEYSFVQITLQDGQIKNFIVFESAKPRAQVIATNFARQEFGDQFLALAVTPKSHIREARVLFEEGKIIGANNLVSKQKVIHHESKMPTETPKQSDKIQVREILLTTKESSLQPLYKEGKAYSAWSGADLFVKGLIGKFSDVYYKVIWQDGETIEGSVDLEPVDFYHGKEEILSSHIQNFFHNLSKTQPNVLYSKKAIEKAKKIMEGYQLKEIPSMAEHSTVVKLQKFDAFALLKQFHDWLKKKDSGYEKATKEDFDSWIEEANPDMGGENPERVWNHHLAMVKAASKLHNKIHGVPKMQPYSSIYNKLLKIIPNLLYHLKKGKEHGKSVIDPSGGLMDLNFDYLGKDKDGNYLIALAHNFEQNGDLMADPDMQIRIIPDLETAEALTFQQSSLNVYQEVYREKDGKQLVNLKLKKDLNSFLNQWLTNIINQGHKIELSKEESETSYEEWDESLSPERPIFNPVVMARLMLEDNFLSSTWSKRHDKSVLEEYRFTKEQYDHINAFYGTYVLMDAVMEKKYKEIYDYLGDKSFTTSEAKENPKSDFERLHTPEEEKEIIEQFIAHGFTRPFSAQEAFDKNLPVIDLAFRYVESMEYFRDHIENPLKEKIQKLKEELKDLKGEKGVNEKRSSLKEQIEQLEAEMTFAEKLVYDESLIFQDDLFEIILNKAKQKDYSFEGEEKISSFRDDVITHILDNRAIESYHKESVGKVVNELIDEYFQKEEITISPKMKSNDKNFYDDLRTALKLKSSSIKSQVVNNLKGSRNESERQKLFDEANTLYFYSGKSDKEPEQLISQGKIPLEFLDKPKPSKELKVIAEDLKSGDTFLPNVLVPAGTKEPFLSQNFQLYNMKSVIKTNFPHLLKINETNLSKASALEMFELVQMPHPTDYGIDVGRMAMLKEWEKRGKELFEELGFPTDNIYPYINLHLGYESIESLNEILVDHNKEGDEWWAVAEHCRPVADANKALEIIEQMIEKQNRERQTLINPKTKKPKLEYKQLARDIDHTIENLKDSKEVLQHYIDNPAETGHSEKAKKETKDPLTNDSGVYTEKTAGKNYEKIEIPMPKAAQYEASIIIVKTSNKDYKIGLDASKKFGDYEGLMFAPGVEGQSYSTREEALKYALKQHELKLELLLIAKDSILGNEEKKIKNLNAALQALSVFAEENGIVLNTPKAPYEDVLLKEIYLSSKEDYSKALVVNTWKEANDFIKHTKWNNDTVYFKVVWKDGEIFERKLDYINAQLYKDKPDPLSDFVYQHNLTVSQMKPLKGSALNDPQIISKAKKLAEGYSYSDKKSPAKEVAIETDEIIPVPGIDIDFGHASAAGDRHRISEETYKKIGKLLQNAKTDLFYYKDAAWTTVKGSTHAILELPEMTGKAKSYYEQVYKTTHAYLKKQPKETGIIRGLEAAYWTEEDNKYPQNKAIVGGMEFQQARLRKVIEDKLEKQPLADLLNITDALSKKFKERRKLATYEKGYVTTGKTGDKRKITLIAIYVDNMILDNDMTDKTGYPVMTFLVDLLFADSQKLVDFPQHIEKQSPTKMKKQNQHELNKEIEDFIDKKDKEGNYFNEEEKNYISQYTGSGGLIKEGAAGRGVLYEYYTPDEVVIKMWGLAHKYGFTTGRVLEPSVGTGNFLKYAPKDATIFGFETSHYSVRIAQILYPHAHIHEKAFETLFFAGNVHLKDDFDRDMPFDLVIGNPPYGEFSGKYAGMGEKQWTGASEYDHYFITRGLDMLKKGGLLIFIIPSGFLSNNSKFDKIKGKIAAKADLIDAYRLPVRTFSTTDIGTDIIVFRKK